MSNATQGDERFICQNCGAPYVATHEQHPTRQKGRFECTDCHAVVHEWDGDRNYFDWKMIRMMPLSHGKPIGQ